MRLSFSLVGVGVIIPGLIYLWRKFRQNSAKEEDLGDPINEAVFFSPQLKECRNRSTGKRSQCSAIACNYCSYNRIVYYLSETKTHLDICHYNLTIEEFVIMIIKLFKKGVFVRIITDEQMSEQAAEVKVLCFRKEYIPIKVIKTSMIMHNKFVIIDNKIVITGSANWTRQGLDGNLENLIITNSTNIARRYKEYFEYIWENSQQFAKF